MAGIPLQQFPGYSQAMLDEVVNATRFGGAEVIKRKGGTFYAVAPMIVELLRAIVFDQKRVLPVSTLLEGQLGMSNVSLSMCAISDILTIYKVGPSIPRSSPRSFSSLGCAARSLRSASSARRIKRIVLD